MALAISSPNIISTFWDFGHRQLKNDPEVSSIFNWIRREYFYSKVTRKSKLIITDSKKTSKLMEKYYGISNKKIRISGLPLPKRLECKTKNKKIIRLAEEKYIIYPATNWHHKNHKFLFKIIKKMTEDGTNLRLILCGPRLRNGININGMIQEFKLQNYVVDLEFIKDSEKYFLIKNAALLIMPTKLGPTNYPIFEAAKLGTRSIISNVHDFESVSHIADQVTIVSNWEISNWSHKIEKYYNE
jgi:glycosyltransferase involved in cell wall biosynthesis